MKTYKFLHKWAILLPTLLLLGTVWANAQNYWINADVNQEWSDANNWSLGNVPTSSDNVIIDFTYAGYTAHNGGGPKLDNNGLLAGSIALANSATIAGNNHTITITGGISDDGSGSVDLSTGTWTIGGDFNVSGSVTHSSSTVVFNGSSAQNITAIAGNTFYNLTIDNSSGGVTLDQTIQINGTLALTSGTFYCGSNTITFAALGSISGTGSNFNAGTGTVIFGGGTGQTQSAVAMGFNNLTVTGSGTSLTVNLSNGGGTTTVSGALTITGGAGTANLVKMNGNLTITGNVGIGSNGVLSTNSTSSTLTVGGTMGTGGTGGAGSAGSLVCTGGTPTVNVVGNWTLSGFTEGTGSTVVFEGGSSQTFDPSGSTFQFRNLTVGAGGSNTSLTIICGGIEIDGTLSGDDGSILHYGDGSNNHEVDLYGDAINSGSGSAFVIDPGTNGSTRLKGASAQNIYGFTFYDLLINNASGADLHGNIIIEDNLDFEVGNFTLNNWNLTIKTGAAGVGTHTPGGAIGLALSDNESTYDSTYDGTDGFVVMNNGFSGGYLIRDVDNTSGLALFPIGDGTGEYTPLTLTSNNATPTQVSIRVGNSLLDGKNPQNSVSTDAVILTWDISTAADRTFYITTDWGNGGNSNLPSQVDDEGGGFSELHDFVSYRANQTAGTKWNPLGSTSGAAATPVGTNGVNNGSGDGGEYSLAAAQGVLFTHANTDWFVATGDNASALPVSLLTFGAQYQDGHVNLNWTTASEQNNAYFDVERSTDAASWTTIGQVQGHGTSNVMNSYVDIDNLAGVVPSGTLYYRLKQVDFNGAFTYSMIRSVDLSNPGPALAMYPNPTSNTLNINWTSATDDDAVLRLINMSGVSVYQQTVSGKGMIQRQIDMSLLPSGVYYLQVISNNGSTVNQAVYKN